MSEAVRTIEGWYALHDFRTVDWTAWEEAPADLKERAVRELLEQVAEWEAAEADKKGSFAVYAIVGQKADLLFLNMRETLEELNAVETKLNRSAFGRFARPAWSYVSVVELSGYTGDPNVDPMQIPEVAARLKLVLPKTRHICFYPMNKRRLGDDNWYMLPFDKRRELMQAHGLTGRKYAGKVRQIVTGSVGLDDWEWGVTLFSDDALQFKKLVYEMRFDEVSARYGEFGPFAVGNLLTREGLELLLR